MEKKVNAATNGMLRVPSFTWHRKRLLLSRATSIHTHIWRIIFKLVHRIIRTCTHNVVHTRIQTHTKTETRKLNEAKLARAALSSLCIRSAHKLKLNFNVREISENPIHIYKLNRTWVNSLLNCENFRSRILNIRIYVFNVFLLNVVSRCL